MIKSFSSFYKLISCVLLIAILAVSLPLSSFAENGGKGEIAELTETLEKHLDVISADDSSLLLYVRFDSNRFVSLFDGLGRLTSRMVYFGNSLENQQNYGYLSSGAKLISYAYDAWGNCSETVHNSTGSFAYAQFLFSIFPFYFISNAPPIWQLR